MAETAADAKPVRVSKITPIITFCSNNFREDIYVIPLGFSSGANEWRNTCTNCRCSRVCHDVTIGAVCCGIDRIGFEPSILLGLVNGRAKQTNAKNGNCYWTSMAEAEGYKWIPPVSTKIFSLIEM